MVRCHCCSQNVVLLVFNFFLNTYVLPHPPPLPFCASHSQHLFPIRFIVFRMWRSWEAGCSPVTWFTARGTGAATVNLSLFRTQKCYFGLIIISIICSFISASLHPPLLCLIIFSFSSPSSPQLGLHEFSLCALSLSAWLFAQLETHVPIASSPVDLCLTALRTRCWIQQPPSRHTSKAAGF